MSIGELWTMLKNGEIDFKGQKRSFDMQFYVIWTAGIIGFVHGYIMASFLLTFYWIFGATLFVAAVCFPSWPWWNRDPVAWLEPEPEESSKDEKKDEKKKSADSKDKKAAKK